MKYTLCQTVRIVDMNDEILTEVLFEHGVVETPQPVIGATVITYQLGLKQFEVVYDKREGKTSRSKIMDMEIDLLGDTNKTRVFLEPVKLIVGQHDVGIV
ncbi:hypothetical protein [Gorillibacterium sp. sgz5001074]|uniref:hypothetical protein n=1 Tax=Gorillibacterium sp. sgz5001074 TaxID=3446695 RepID=UPI003F662132